MKYNTIVIDPPWQVRMGAIPKCRPNRARELPYKTMTTEQIKQFPIKEFANEGAHVYLWATNSKVIEALEVLREWEVRFHLIMPLVKPTGMTPLLTGYKFAAEYCILGFYHPPMQKFIGSGKLNWIKGFNKAGQHSSKPDEFYKLVETMSPGPRIDIFSRKKREGWDQHGDECSKFNN